MEDDYIPTFLIVNDKFFKIGGDTYPNKGDFVKLGNMGIEIYRIEHEYNFDGDEIVPVVTNVYGKEINV